MIFHRFLNHNAQKHVITLAFLFLMAGCGRSSPEIDARYAATTGKSLNGLNVFMEQLKSLGNDVRVAHGLDEEVGEFATVIFRFADESGPPEIKEADWFDQWLRHDPANRLVYIPRDTNLLIDYWQYVVDHPDPAWSKEQLDEARKRLEKARSNFQPSFKSIINKTPKSKWFELKMAPNIFPEAGEGWSGPFAEKRLNWPIHQAISMQSGDVLLKCSSGVVISTAAQLESQQPDARKLIIANAGFLMNAGLVDPTRRTLAEKTIEFLDLHTGDENVVMLVGDDMFDTAEPNAIHRFLTTWPFSAISAHLIVLGLVLCWSRAARMGPARDETEETWQLLSAHTRAVGKVMLKAGDWHQTTTEKLARYQNWRFPKQHQIEIEAGGQAGAEQIRSDSQT